MYHSNPLTSPLRRGAVVLFVSVFWCSSSAYFDALRQRILVLFVSVRCCSSFAYVDALQSENASKRSEVGRETAGVLLFGTDVADLPCAGKMWKRKQTSRKWRKASRLL
jgi:hypothetical protein